MVKCKNCKEKMVERGFKGHNDRFECDKCNIRMVSFYNRYLNLKHNFLGYDKWSKNELQ